MYKKAKFKNGVRLMTAQLKETSTVTLLVLVKVGSRYENKKEWGASHFLEHLMFKGTKSRPDAMAITKELDGVGAEFNAFTSKDYTGYYVKIDAKHIDLAVDILSDMLLNSKLDDKEIERERGVIIEEINMYEDIPLRYVDTLLEKIVFDSSTLGQEILGDKESIQNMSRDDLVGYLNESYRGDNVVIGLAGNFDDQVVKKIEASFTFDDLKTERKFELVNIDQKKPKIGIHFKKTEQIYWAVGLPAYSYSDPRLVTLKLLSVILGGNMSSRLFLQIRERHGLAYFVRSSVDSYEDTGLLVISAGLDLKRVDQATDLILKELNLIKDGVTTDELDRAKNYLIGKIAIDLEDSSSLSQWYVQQELLTGQVLTPEEMVSKIKSVTLKQIDQVASDVIDLNKLSLALIGPIKDEKRFRDIIEKNI
jgi:predicted Zn-dependent peptidase